MFRIVNNNLNLPCFLQKEESAQGKKMKMKTTPTIMNIKKVASNRLRIIPTPAEIRKSELEKVFVSMSYLSTYFLSVKHQLSKGMNSPAP